MTDEQFDPTSRRLCPDGGCVGLIGPDGRCRECGRPDDGSSATVGAATDADSDFEPPGGQTDLFEAASIGSTERTATADGFDPGRRLCDDGACVGVIGPSGRCGLCGRASDAP